MTLLPEATARVARAAFARGNLSMRRRDELGRLFTDEAFVPLFAGRGRPAEAPGRLALVTIRPYIEGFSERQAADAVRRRIAWPYLLGLELTDPGFDSTVWSEFRPRLRAGRAEHHRLEAVRERCRERKRLRAHGRQRTDSTPVVGAMRAVNRLVCVAEAMRQALHRLAVAAPEWLRAHRRPEGLER